jgi:hypothetical protein
MHHTNFTSGQPTRSPVAATLAGGGIDSEASPPDQSIDMGKVGTT